MFSLNPGVVATRLKLIAVAVERLEWKFAGSIFQLGKRLSGKRDEDEEFVAEYQCP